MSSASQKPQDSSKTAIQDISTVFLVESTVKAHTGTEAEDNTQNPCA